MAFEGSVVRIAAPHPTMSNITGWAGLTYEALEPQQIGDYGLREVDLLVEWLKAR